MLTMGIKHRADSGLRKFLALGEFSCQLRNAIRFITEPL